MEESGYTGMSGYSSYDIPTDPLWVIDESKFSQDENRVLRHLAVAWNEFLALPRQHPDDLDEFRYAIHSAQRIVALRGVRMNWGFPTVPVTCYMSPTDSYAWGYENESFHTPLQYAGISSFIGTTGKLQDHLTVVGREGIGISGVRVDYTLGA